MEQLWSPWRMTYLQNNSPKQSGCVFCNALATPEHDAQTFILHRGEHCFVILNLYPYNNGHLMIAPVAHVPSLEEMPREATTELMTLSQHALKILRAAYAPQGFNIGVNIGEAAGAGIPGHVHLHVVPRWAGDTNFMSVSAHTRVIPEMVEQTYKRLKELW